MVLVEPFARSLRTPRLHHRISGLSFVGLLCVTWQTCGCAHSEFLLLLRAGHEQFGTGNGWGCWGSEIGSSVGAGVTGLRNGGGLGSLSVWGAIGSSAKGIPPLFIVVEASRGSLLSEGRA